MSLDRKGYLPRGLLTTVALLTATGPYIADFNETHVYNPLWPGHAKFHNGQTMSMGFCLGVCTLWKTYWDDNDRLFTAAIFASIYWVTQFSAYFYPGSTAWDPPHTASLAFPQFFILSPLLVMTWLAYGLEQRRLQVGGAKKKA